MTKEAIKRARELFKKIDGGAITVMLDENIKFSSLDTFLIWDDVHETLMCLTTNQDPMMASNKNHRGELFTTEYDKIVCMSTIPNLSAIDTWLPVVTDGLDTDNDRIKQSFESITKEKYFL